MEITHFERMCVDDLSLNFLILSRGRLLEGEKGLAYWYMPATTLLPTLYFSL